MARRPQAAKIDGLNGTVEDHFEALAREGAWDALYDGPETSANVSFRARLARTLELVPGAAKAVLDVGCGPAPLGPELARRGSAYFGLDFSQEMLRRARVRLSAARLVRGVVPLPFRDQSFDVVVALGFLEYLRDIHAALAEMRRVVRPAGVVLVSIPKRWHVDRLMIGMTTPLRHAARAMWGRRSDSLRRTLLTPGRLDTLAFAAGLRPDAGTHYHFTPLPYPLTVLAPQLTLRLNRLFERPRRSGGLTLLAHGYIGRYRRD